MILIEDHTNGEKPDYNYNDLTLIFGSISLVVNPGTIMLLILISGGVYWSKPGALIGFILTPIFFYLTGYCLEKSNKNYISIIFFVLAAISLLIGLSILFLFIACANDYS